MSLFMSENILKNTTFEDCLLAGEDFDKVEGFDNYYVTTLGRIWNIKESCWDGDFAKVYKKKVYSEKQTGAKTIKLIDSNGRELTKSVARIVAETFVENPNNYKYVKYIKEPVYYSNEKNNAANNLRWEEFDLTDVDREDKNIEEAKERLKSREIENAKNRITILNGPHPVPEEFGKNAVISFNGVPTKYHINEKGDIFDEELNKPVHTTEIECGSGKTYWAFELRDADGYMRPYTKAKLIGYAFGELTEEDLLDQDVRWEPKDGNRKNVVLENLIFIKKPKNIRTKEAAIEYYENLIKGLKEQD